MTIWTVGCFENEDSEAVIFGLRTYVDLNFDFRESK